MNVGSNNNNTTFNIDNAQIRNEIQDVIDKGRKQFNSSDSVEEKDQGIATFLSGLKKLELWIQIEKYKVFQKNMQILIIIFKIISGEQDQTINQDLRQQYQNNYKEVDDMLTKLEQVKKQIPKPMDVAQGGSGYNQGQDEKSEFRKKILDTFVTEKPNVKWDDIAGLVKAKEQLKEAVILPTRFPDNFKSDSKICKGILLYGPPGTGKTYLAKACATETEGTFFSLSSSDINNKFSCESERLIKNLFALAREKKPSIIFIDEIDDLYGRIDLDNDCQRRVQTEFQIQMQGIGNDNTGVLILGATNQPWKIDPSFRKRFQKRIYTPLPDQLARRFLLKHCLKNNTNCLSDEYYDKLAEQTTGFTGFDVSIIARNAMYEPLRRLSVAKKFKKLPGDKFLPVDDNASGPDIIDSNYLNFKEQQYQLDDVTEADFAKVAQNEKPSVDFNDLKRYEEWTDEFGQDG